MWGRLVRMLKVIVAPRAGRAVKFLKKVDIKTKKPEMVSMNLIESFSETTDFRKAKGRWNYTICPNLNANDNVLL